MQSITLVATSHAVMALRLVDAGIPTGNQTVLLRGGKTLLQI
mgnify:CR=1 FL=1